MTFRSNNTYILSTKCYFHNVNKAKSTDLDIFLKEYTKLCNLFINELWNRHKNNIDIPNRFNKIDYIMFNSVLSSRLRVLCIQQASSIVRSRIEQINQFVNTKRYKNPSKKNFHKNKTILEKLNVVPLLEKECCIIDSKCSTINLNPDTKKYDLAVTLKSFGKLELTNRENIKESKIKTIELLLNKNKHFNELLSNGKLLNGIIITKEYIQFNFQFTKQENNNKEIVGIDIGCKTLLTSSNNEQITCNDKGKPFIQIVKELSKKKVGSKSFQRKCSERNNCIGYCVNKLNLSNTKQLNIENIQYLRYKKRTSKLLKHWNYDYIFDRLEQFCLKQNVSVNKINQRYTSQRCNQCGYVHYLNRKSEKFKCLQCGYATNADINASKNILIIDLLHSIPESIINKKSNRNQGFYWDYDSCIESLEPSITLKQ